MGSDWCPLEPVLTLPSPTHLPDVGLAIHGAANGMAAVGTEATLDVEGVVAGGRVVAGEHSRGTRRGRRDCVKEIQAGITAVDNQLGACEKSPHMPYECLRG